MLYRHFLVNVESRESSLQGWLTLKYRPSQISTKQPTVSVDGRDLLRRRVLSKVLDLGKHRVDPLHPVAPTVHQLMRVVGFGAVFLDGEGGLEQPLREAVF